GCSALWVKGIVAGGGRWRSVLDGGRPQSPIGKLAISLAVFAVSSVPPRGWGAGVTWPTTPNLAMSLPNVPTGMPPHETVPWSTYDRPPRQRAPHPANAIGWRGADPCHDRGPFRTP